MAASLSTVAASGKACKCRVRRSVVFGRPDIYTFVGNVCMELVPARYLRENCDLAGRRHGLESECGYPGESEEIVMMVTFGWCRWKLVRPLPGISLVLLVGVR